MIETRPIRSSVCAWRRTAWSQMGPMGIGKGPKPPSYNGQTAVDAETGLIIHHEVTTEPTDNRLLYRTAKGTKEAVEADVLTVVADAGYSNGADAAACERGGITPCAPAIRSSNNQGGGALFDRSAFVYQPDSDTYSCPAGRTLARKQIIAAGQLHHLCGAGLLRMHPQAELHHRRAPLADPPSHEGALQRMDARIEADPSLMRKRRCAAEHPSIKRMTAGGRFLTRGLTEVKAEAALTSWPTMSCAPSIWLAYSISAQALPELKKEAPDRPEPSFSHSLAWPPSGRAVSVCRYHPRG